MEYRGYTVPPLYEDFIRDWLYNPLVIVPANGWHCLCGSAITITRSYPDGKVTGWRCDSKDIKVTITCRTFISSGWSDKAQKIAKLLGEPL